MYHFVHLIKCAKFLSARTAAGSEEQYGEYFTSWQEAAADGSVNHFTLLTAHQLSSYHIFWDKMFFPAAKLCAKAHEQLYFYAIPAIKMIYAFGRMQLSEIKFLFFPYSLIIYLYDCTFCSSPEWIKQPWMLIFIVTRRPKWISRFGGRLCVLDAVCVDPVTSSLRCSSCLQLTVWKQVSAVTTVSSWQSDSKSPLPQLSPVHSVTASLCCLSCLEYIPRRRRVRFPYNKSRWHL